ncbi:MAG: hypothetical protein ACJASQ_000162 [Crocinitomicaceae bacterium]|jgi:hypothetical protein
MSDKTDEPERKAQIRNGLSLFYYQENYDKFNFWQNSCNLGMYERSTSSRYAGI